MKTGRMPGSRRGITRRSSVQREIPVDPSNVAFIRAAVLQSEPSEISERMQRAINDLGIVLKDLTAKEKEAYSLVRANGYSFGAAAQIMQIQKATVQTLVKRAEEKISDMVEDLTDRGIVFKQDVQLEMF
jgi:DNA-directed RNA polymerase specialized sigma subunit, sigma24 homolog